MKFEIQKQNKQEITTGNKYIDSLPEKYRNYIQVGNILVVKIDTNTYHPYILIKDILEENNIFKLSVWKYTYHKDIGLDLDDEGYGRSIYKTTISLSDLENYYLRDLQYCVKNKQEIIDNINSCENVNLDNYTIQKAQENAIVHLGSTTHLESMKNGLQEKTDNLAQLSASLELKIFEQKQKLEHIKREMDDKLRLLRDEVNRIERIIWTIELYIGIKEDVVQIQEGNSASKDEPIKIFQTCSFMDEEVADPQYDGIDMSSIDKFDDWLCDYNTYHKKKNYEIIMYPRSILMFRVRRYDKKYNENPFINAIMNEENHKTYILIRNGDNLYRIWADINIEKFFPDPDEFENIGKKDRSYYQEGIYKLKDFDDLNDEEQTKIFNEKRDAFIHYQRHFIMLQGLIDRTDIFSPMPKFKISEEFDSGKMEYLYDNSIKLPTEKPLFHQWVKEINKYVKKGSRIVWGGGNSCRTQERFPENFVSYRRPSNETWGLPNPPTTDLYTIEKVFMSNRGYYGYAEKETMSIKIENSNLKWKWDYDETKSTRKISYKVYPEEDTIINYDLCTLEDIEYYIHSREDRKGYLRMIPLLMKVKEWLLKDKEIEKEFTKMMLDEFKREKVNVDEWRVLKAIDWWKTKNKWKRSVNSDDAKAYRMIKKHILKEYNDSK